MNKKTKSLEILDFYRIRVAVADYALSEEGKNFILNSHPLYEEESVEKLKSTVRAIRQAFEEVRQLPHTSYPVLGEIPKKLYKQGTVLEVEELWALGLWADSWEREKEWLLHIHDRNLSELLGSAPSLDEIVKTVFRIVDREGQVRDLPELREIRKRIQHLNSEIERVTSYYFQDEQSRAILQNDLPTQRDGRTVLAVKVGSKSKVKGIVHEVSQSGQTVFIEPEDLVQKNNQLVEEEARYQRELLRILKETTARLHLQNEKITNTIPVLEEADGLYARARYSHVGKGVFAEPVKEGLSLVKARHPVLGKRAVPIDLALPENARTLIITGPNTGGKTVSLKTVGLFALMNQFGLALPLEPGSTLPVFDSVWADIGDEQSIDQSLSTFSGHMQNIAAIIEGATSRSLVLLDELGSGTDPEEGCAIAMALLDSFIERGALTMLTTHHGILKNFGYTREAVINASVDFDKNTLSPTYRILMGIPGESRALEIAEKNGIDDELIKAARAYLHDERTDVSAMIRGLSEKNRELDRLKDEEIKRLRDARDEQRKAELKKLQLKQKESELRTHGIAELKTLLDESRKTLENLVRLLREGELTKEKTRAVKEFLAELETSAQEAEKDLDEIKEQDRIESAEERELEPGLPVFIMPFKKKGTLLRQIKKGHWLVETSTMRLTVEEHNLTPRAEDKPVKPGVLFERGSSSGTTVKLELDIRGYRYSEALEALEKQMDAAILAGLGSFSIIHGTGEGILQETVKSFLSGNPLVKAFRYALPEDGGHGKTFVSLNNS